MSELSGNDERTGVAFTVADSSKDEQALLRSTHFAIEAAQ